MVNDPAAIRRADRFPLGGAGVRGWVTVADDVVPQGCAEADVYRGHQAAGDVHGATAAANQVLAIGVTSYNGMLYLGVNADREAASDLDVPPSWLRESLDELLEAAP